MYEPTAYVVIKETTPHPYPETEVISVVTSEREAWYEITKKLNDILNNCYADAKFIPHQTMPYYIGIEYTECSPYPPYSISMKIKYTIHKKRVTTLRSYKAYCV